jgi:uncharacterized protein YecE (DUF72 family)
VQNIKPVSDQFVLEKKKDVTLRQNYFCGTSGIQVPFSREEYPIEYKGASRLNYYSSIFNSLEINSTFKKLPRPGTITRWTEEVGKDFRFTFKIIKDVTHSKGLTFEPEVVDTFFNTIKNVGEKRGCILLQFPPSQKVGALNKLQSIFDAIRPWRSAWEMAVEFRNNSWYNDEVYNLLADYRISLVLHDKSGSAPPLLMSTETVYLRFHGPTGNYRGSYDSTFLKNWSAHIDEWLNSGKTVYVYFNNTMGDAFKNLQTLNMYLSR